MQILIFEPPTKCPQATAKDSSVCNKKYEPSPDMR
jgi:hypothetical protein